MNRIELIGNLTKDPELRTTKDGLSVCTFRIAVNKKKKDDVMYYRVTAWRQLAESCGKYLLKGCKVYVDGDLDIDEFVGNDGEKRFSLEVNAVNIEFLSSKADVDRMKGNREQEPAPKGGFQAVETDELPF